jgi:uncharacterized protein
MLSHSLLHKASVWAFVATSSRSRTVPVGNSLWKYATTALSMSSSSSAAAASSGPPTKYVLTYRYIPDVLEKRGPFRAEHLGLAQDMARQGQCALGGPTTPLNTSVPTGAVFVFTDLESAQRFVQQDPYVANGIVTEHSIEEWTVAIQMEK